MTIVRSGGVATLVALMSAHRAAAGGPDTAASFGPEMVAAIEAYLRDSPEPSPPALPRPPAPRRDQTTASRPSYS